MTLPLPPGEAGQPTRLERLWYGHERSPLAIPLTLAHLPFRFGVALRNWAYDVGLLGATRVEGVKVVSVGNLTVGGAGKTPAVLYLARWAQAAGQKVAVLTRGYGRASSEPVVFDGASLPKVEVAGDEPRLIARSCPGVKLYVGADRVAMAGRARDEGATFVLLDDGFQHRRLARDVDLVVLDGEYGLGHVHLLPLGPFREGLSALARAHLVWLKSSGPAVEPPREAKATVRVVQEASAWLDPSGAEHPLGALEDQPVVALAGLARPGGFLASLRKCGARVEAAHLYADHHRFTAAELEAARADAAKRSARVVTTEKDAERLPDGFEAWRLRLSVRVTDGLELLASALGLPAELAPKGTGG